MSQQKLQDMNHNELLEDGRKHRHRHKSQTTESTQSKSLYVDEASLLKHEEEEDVPSSGSKTRRPKLLVTADATSALNHARRDLFLELSPQVVIQKLSSKEIGEGTHKVNLRSEKIYDDSEVHMSFEVIPNSSNTQKSSRKKRSNKEFSVVKGDDSIMDQSKDEIFNVTHSSKKDRKRSTENETAETGTDASGINKPSVAQEKHVRNKLGRILSSQTNELNSQNSVDTPSKGKSAKMPKRKESHKKSSHVENNIISDGRGDDFATADHKKKKDRKRANEKDVEELAPKTKKQRSDSYHTDSSDTEATSTNVRSCMNEAERHTLLSNMDTLIPADDKKKYHVRLIGFDWSKVTFDDFTSEQCKQEWKDILPRLRVWRTLRELVEDAQSESFKMNRGYAPRATVHPDQPQCPKSEFFRFLEEHWDELARRYPNLEQRQLMKPAAIAFRELSADEKKKYKDARLADYREYRLKMKKFCEIHPEVHEPSEKKYVPLSATIVYIQKRMKRVLTTHPEIKKFDIINKYRKKWGKLSDEEKLKYIRKAVELNRIHEEEVQKQESGDNTVPAQRRTEFLTKAEQVILNKADGVPEKPPVNGFILYSQRIREKMTEELKALSMVECQKVISNQWHSLSEEKRQHYARKAAKKYDKYKEFMKEHPEYAPPVLVKVKVPKKSLWDGEPKKVNTSAYLMFCKKVMPTLLHMETLKERMGVISQRWSKLSKKEKDKLHKEIDAQMAVYQQELADFKATLSADELERYTASTSSKSKKASSSDSAVITSSKTTKAKATSTAVGKSKDAHGNNVKSSAKSKVSTESAHPEKSQSLDAEDDDAESADESSQAVKESKQIKTKSGSKHKSSKKSSKKEHKKKATKKEKIANGDEDEAGSDEF